MGVLLFGGNDHLRIRGRLTSTVVSSEGNDVVVGGAGRDRIGGQDGADVVRSRQQNDLVSGDDGPDHLLAGAGSDRLFGLRGRDALRGGPGRDSLFANHDDRDAVIDCGSGRDVAVIDENLDPTPRHCEVVRYSNGRAGPPGPLLRSSSLLRRLHRRIAWVRRSVEVLSPRLQPSTAHRRERRRAGTIENR